MHARGTNGSHAAGRPGGGGPAERALVHNETPATMGGDRVLTER
eukprot:COSAG02_NODE_37030_length_447_cov_1.022989_1_plen_43_part_10